MVKLGNLIQRVSWQETEKEVQSLNPDIATAINNVEPNSKLRLYRIRYLFGETILKKGLFYLPNASGQVVPITDQSIPTEVQNDLSYNYMANPVSISLKNTAELFLNLNDRIIPYRLLYPGALLGAWGAFDPKVTHHPMAIWEMSAGARSIFMLPKITDLVSHKRLQKAFSVTLAPPIYLSDQWKVFSEITQHVKNSQPWYTDILFFPKQWIDHLHKPAWASLKTYLLESVWKSSNFLRNQIFWDLIYSAVQEQKNIPPNPYVTALIKQLFSMTQGATAGFCPALDERVAPIKFLQNVYTDGPYKMRRYQPIFMVPGTFSVEDEKSHPIYFSPSYSTALEFSTKINKRPSVITDLKQIKFGLDAYRHGILKSEFKSAYSLLTETIEKVQFDFFHYNPEEIEGIRSNASIPLEDIAFKRAANGYADRTFPTAGPFVRSCIRISFQKTKKE